MTKMVECEGCIIYLSMVIMGHYLLIERAALMFIWFNEMSMVVFDRVAKRGLAMYDL